MKLERWDRVAFEGLRNVWIGLLNGSLDITKADYEQLFDLIEQSGCWGPLSGCFNKPIYGTIVDEQQEVWGIVEIVISKRGSSAWVKMMNLYLTPKIEENTSAEINVDKRLLVFSSALLGIFGLTKDVAGADTVKVYGRTESLVSFLRGVHSAIEAIFAAIGGIKGVSVSIEGRWLVFRSN